MKSPFAALSLLAGLALVSSSPAFASEERLSPSSIPEYAANLVAQQTLEAALDWLQEEYPIGSSLENDPAFLYEADDVVVDPESGLLLVAYHSRTDNGSAWLAWVGLDDWVVVLVEGVKLPSGRSP